MAVTVDLDLVRASFLEDATEHMTALEAALVNLEKNPSDSESLNSAFRAVHTLKGSGGIFKYDELIRFAHSLENMLDALRDHTLTLGAETVSILFKGYDQLQALLDYYSGSDDAHHLAELAQVSNIIILRINQIMAGAANAKPIQDELIFEIRSKPELFKAGFAPENALRYLLKNCPEMKVKVYPVTLPALRQFDPRSAYLGLEISLPRGNDPDQIRAAVHEAFEFLSAEIDVRELAPPTDSGESLVAEVNAQVKSVSARSAKSIRVDSDKLDLIVNLVGELVMKNGSLMQIARSRDSKEFLRPMSEMSRLVEAVREVAMNLRMVPIGGTFRKMERLVRDLADASGKELEIVFEGEETELDKTIIEKINDPLVHIIRNAVDHGLEMPEQREKMGKSRRGTIRLSAYHEAGNIVVEVTDDGAGLNYARIKERAIARGLAEPGREYTDTEIQQFIFAPGFSTAEAVSEISGRGVGMDVVKRNIEAMRGTIRITSVENRGMTLRIMLPLTLAIIDGFLVRAHEQKFVIPLDTIKECIDLKSLAANASQYNSNLFNLRGEVLPFLRLTDVFDLGRAEAERESLVVIQHGASRFGVVIDEPLGEYQTVIKPLTGFLSRMPGIGGVTILGMRDLALILDIQGLLELTKKDRMVKG